MPLDDATPIVECRNLGPTSSRYLQQMGVYTLGDLKSLGPVAVYVSLLQRHVKPSLNLLWAMMGAVEQRDWREINAIEKSQALELVHALKKRFQSPGL